MADLASEAPNSDGCLPADRRSCGEAVLRSPWLTPCYTGDPEASTELWRGRLARVRQRLDPTVVEAGDISRYATLDQLHIVEALPRTSMGKIDKKLIWAQVAAQAPQAGG